MNTSFLPCMRYFVMVALWAVAGACSVSDSGLGTPPDGSTGGAGEAVCPAGLTEQASWPAKTFSTSCSRPCGPDGLGVQTCSQTDRATCQSQPGCVCLEAPCVVCATCTFKQLPDCYAPTNTTSISLCAEGVARGGICTPACGRRLCLEADGMTGCVCNEQGKYACADWGDSGWQ